MTLLAVLALCMTAYAVKDNAPTPIKKTMDRTPNPNWDLKQQVSEDTHPADPAKEVDAPNPNAVEVASSPEGGLGNDCSNPASITIGAALLPVSVLNQTNCGGGNTYSNTCLGSYDGGEDITYKLTVTDPVTVNITLNPKGTSYTGWAIDATCPLNATTCLYKMTGPSIGYTMNGVVLAAGTYYMMVDTWPTPNCIPNFDITFVAPPPPPANDNCASATAIGNVTNLAFDCSAATFDGPGTYVNNRNIWYCYTADCTGMATASLCGTSYDTKMQIWDNCTCPPTVVVANNDDGCSGFGSGSTLASKVSWDAVAGHQYMIEVGPYSATTTVGTGLLTTSCTVPPTGSSCGLPLPVTINPSVFPLTLSAQTNCGFFNTYSNTCLGSYDGGEDIIYRLDVTQPVYMQVTMDPKTSTYTGFLIDDACPPDPTTCLYKKTSSSAVIYSQGGISLAPGTYWLMVDTYPSPTCIPTFDITFDVSPGPPPNDNCTAPTAIGDVTDLLFATDQATVDGPGGFIVSPNIWYCYTATCTGAVTVSLCNSSYDTRVRVFDGCACPTSTTSLVEDDDACVSPNGLASVVTFAGIAGNQYMIEVGGYGTATGTGHMTVSCTPPPPNDNCTSVTPVPLVYRLAVDFHRQQRRLD